MLVPNMLYQKWRQLEEPAGSIWLARNARSFSRRGADVSMKTYFPVPRRYTNIRLHTQVDEMGLGYACVTTFLHILNQTVRNVYFCEKLPHKLLILKLNLEMIWFTTNWYFGTLEKFCLKPQGQGSHWNTVKSSKCCFSSKKSRALAH